MCAKQIDMMGYMCVLWVICVFYVAKQIHIMGYMCAKQIDIMGYLCVLCRKSSPSTYIYTYICMYAAYIHI